MKLKINIIKILVILLIILAGILIYGSIKYTYINKEYNQQLSNNGKLHSISHNSNGDKIYNTKFQYYTRDNIRDSKDTVIQNLLKEYDNLKLRKVEDFIHTRIEVRYKYIVQVKHDTVIIVNNDTIKLKDYDEYDNGILHLVRTVTIDNPDTANYTYSYTPNMSIAINWYKEGKWHINNIWNWRSKIWVASIKSNDTNMIIKNTRVIHIGKLKK